MIALREPARMSFSLASRASHWTASHASISEALSEPYSVTLTLQSSDASLDPADLLGERVTLQIERGVLERKFHGVVDEVSTTGDTGGEAHGCLVRVVPALAMLAHRRDSRIFQGMTVPDILKEVLGSLADYDGTFAIKTSRKHPVCEYRTQYDETDLELVQRLLGEEGMFYFFETDGDVEHLVIAEDASAYVALESVDADLLPFTGHGAVDGQEAVTAFDRADRLRPTKLSLRHFDWTRPDVPLETSSPAPSSKLPRGVRLGAVRESFEHDAEPITLHRYSPGSLGFEGDDLTDKLAIRRDEHVLSAQSHTGSSTAVGLAPGRIFSLVEHPNPSLCEEYVVTSSHHDIHVGDGASDTASFGAALDATYANHFTAVRSSLLVRAPRRKKRHVPGVLTATVVGPKGQEIHTDEHGRIKVQFHWDRKGKSDELSSCYLRVMQAWAGAGFGTWFLPRIGMEAVVSFVEGDPDRPLVTGTVYNGVQRPPFPLPNESTRSGIRTNSTPTMGGYNELRFEDSAGAEEVFLQAQKDLTELVKHDHYTQVLGNQTNAVVGLQMVTVGIDRSIAVVGTETTSIGGTRTETVTGAETIRLLDARDVDVTGADKLVVQDSQSVLVQGAQDIEVRAGRTTTIDGNDTLTVDGGDKHTTVHGAYEIEVDARHRVTHGSSYVLVEDKIESSSPTKVLLVSGGNHVDVDSGGTVTVTAASELVLQCGSAKISLTSDGTIAIQGSQKVDIAVGSTTATSTTSGYSLNGTQIDVFGSGQVKVKGGMVDVG